MTKANVMKLYHDSTGDLPFILNGQLKTDVNRCINWNATSRSGNLTKETILRFKDKLNWTELSEHQHIPEDVLESCIDYIDFDAVSKDTELSLSFIKNHVHSVNWTYISMNNSNLTDDFIYSHGSYIKFKELLCYNINRPTLSLNTIERWYAYLFINLYTSAESLKVYSILSEVMTEEFIEHNWDRLDHDGVICMCNVSDDFINRHRDSISYESLIIANKQPTPTWDKAPIEWLRNNFHLIKDWRLLLRFKKLSDDLLDDIWLHVIPLDILVDFGYVTERFLYKFYRYVDLNKLMSAYYMKFTERFICDMLTLTDIDIDRVVITQILSEDFIHTFRKYLNWNLVCKYQLEQMSEEFIRKHKRYVNWSILRDSDREWSDKFYSKFLLNLLD